VVQAGVSARTTTQDIANLASPLYGFPGYYGQFVSTSNQTNAGATSANIVTFSSTVDSDGVTLASSSRITATNAGVYMLQYSLVVEKNDGGNDDIDVWVLLNGSNISNSNARATLTAANVKTVLSGSFLVTLAAGGYVQLAWSSADVDMLLKVSPADVSPSRPTAPSAHATLTLVKEI
jgi:hypothetical protein